MSRTTVTEALRRIGQLTPVYDAPNLRGHGAWVCSPVADMPSGLRVLQAVRTGHYLNTGDRNGPADCPRYYVTSYGELVAWVALDGSTVYPRLAIAAEHGRARVRHQDAIRAAWGNRVDFPKE